jgi:hypothetical protein
MVSDVRLYVIHIYLLAGEADAGVLFWPSLARHLDEGQSRSSIMGIRDPDAEIRGWASLNEGIA